MSQNVIRRTREIGIRIAVGATPAMIGALVLAELGWILVIGLGLGIPAAFAGGQAARSLLSVTPTHTMLLLAVTGLAIGGGAVLVSAWPARRAAAVPVATALSCE
jgi:ABC-type antimicrobial peptide transport system permease subunit